MISETYLPIHLVIMDLKSMNWSGKSKFRSSERKNFDQKRKFSSYKRSHILNKKPLTKLLKLLEKEIKIKIQWFNAV